MLTPEVSVHHGSEAEEERCCVVRSRARLRVKLNGEAGFSDDVQPLDGSVVGVDVANLHLGAVLI